MINFRQFRYSFINEKKYYIVKFCKNPVLHIFGRLQALSHVYVYVLLLCVCIQNAISISVLFISYYYMTNKSLQSKQYFQLFSKESFQISRGIKFGFALPEPFTFLWVFFQLIFYFSNSVFQYTACISKFQKEKKKKIKVRFLSITSFSNDNIFI